MKTPHSIVTVKNKFQVVIPQHVRKQLGIQQGDVLEAKVERGRLIYVPKTIVVIDRSQGSVVDGEYTQEQRRQIDARLKEARNGPFFGPFKNGDEIAKFLKTRASKTSAKRPKNKPGR